MSDTNYLRNDPTETFDAHLFTEGSVRDRDGDVDEQADRPVPSICSRTTAYGPFREVAEGDIEDDLPGHDGGLCEVCKTTAAANGDDGSDSGAD